ncbi:molybdopterin biosynthesis protein MoeB [Gimesia panareensis]|uniref:Molybdopterin biosynthesis protein MoeB n=1 Tax=Gimesia panareensis TaxID=2527978 RepID=A0A517QB05_9PLAN|nr:rhodanese-like domain-containing protein [Gimesia panareensis]QDT28813.1 molybdopterin biosynthesis protein MoeB [Gimesia panareensis]
MQTISTTELRGKMQRNEKGILVNTLTQDEFEKAHIPNSLNIPEQQDDFVSQVEQAAGSKELPVIVYCASQECGSSEQAAQKLEQAGFSNVYDYEGGAKSWSEAGEQLVAGA